MLAALALVGCLFAPSPRRSPVRPGLAVLSDRQDVPRPGQRDLLRRRLPMPQGMRRGLPVAGGRPRCAARRAHGFTYTPVDRRLHQPDGARLRIRAALRDLGRPEQRAACDAGRPRSPVGHVRARQSRRCVRRQDRHRRTPPDDGRARSASLGQHEQPGSSTSRPHSRSPTSASPSRRRRSPTALAPSQGARRRAADGRLAAARARSSRPAARSLELETPSANAVIYWDLGRHDAACLVIDVQ